ncbi:unknown [Bacteroides sp. CAG:20]|nr:hypothetical protein DWW17_02750 [Bacteroides sp. AF14-46]CCX96115.1 unknown [Bacteroides sp. CAG:20]
MIPKVIPIPQFHQSPNHYSKIFSRFRDLFSLTTVQQTNHAHQGPLYFTLQNAIKESSENIEYIEAVLNLFRDRLRPMLKQIGVRDMQSIAGY